MKFVGIDLAWSENNSTGIAILEGDRRKATLSYCNIIDTNDDILNLINEKVGKDNALIAIDAPLIVPNKEGRREAERVVGNFFRKYNAGAHPANRTRLSSFTGSIRGEDISRILEKNGFEHDPYIKLREEKRKFFEVYPHPSMVVLFNLDTVIKYKAKPKRDYEFRWKEFRKYQNYLADLKNADPSLILPDEITRKNVRKLKGSALKNYEDMLDGIFCAYIAYYSWANPEKCAVLGSMKQGYIMTPIFDSMRKELKNRQSSLNKFMDR